MDVRRITSRGSKQWLNQKGHIACKKLANQNLSDFFIAMIL
jgi:hypothetical protein